jgi:mycothiol system anti-sigma-R factor
MSLDDGGRPCDEALSELYHFLDGELTVERRVEIQRHLDECGPCLEAFDFEAELRSVVAERCRERVPDGLRERIAGLLSCEGGGGGETRTGREQSVGRFGPGARS